MSKSVHEKVDYVCRGCKLDNKKPKKLSAKNNMIPGKIPDHLKGLTTT